MTVENDSEAWREILAPVDSIANAVFLVAGGALSLSITVTLGDNSSAVLTDQAITLTTHAWYALLGAVVLFLLLKTHLVFQAFALQFWPNFLNGNLGRLNAVGWVSGIAGMLVFIFGLTQMVRAAAIVITGAR